MERKTNNFKKSGRAPSLFYSLLLCGTLLAVLPPAAALGAPDAKAPAELKPAEIILSLFNKSSDSVELRAQRARLKLMEKNGKAPELKTAEVNKTEVNKAEVKTAAQKSTGAPSETSQITTGEQLSLTECVNIAIVTNPQILESQFNINTYKYKLEQSKASLRPQTSAGAKGGWQGSDTQTRAGETSSLYSSRSANLNYSQLLYDGGKVKSGIEAAETNLEIHQLNHKKLLMDIFVKICENYYSSVTSLRLEKVALQAYEGSLLHQNLAEANFNVGISPKTDFIRAQTNTFEKKYALIAAQNANKKSRLALNYTLGRAGFDIVVIDSLTCDTIGIDLESSINKALLSRSEIEAAKKGIEVYKLQIKQIKAEKAPQISLGANAGLDFDNSANKNERSSYSVFTSISMPITNGYITENKISELEEKIRAEEQKLQQLILTIKYDVNQAYLNLFEAYEQIGAAAKNVEYADLTLKLTDEQYKVGLATMLDLIDAELAYNRAMTNHIQSQGNFLTAKCKFRRHIGDEEFYR
jgi:outer membrane protein